MCVLIVKHFDNIGWVGAKNRDRNYTPEISFRREYSDSYERLIMHDDTTKYMEGINEHGIAVLSISLCVLRDEKEISQKHKSKRPSKDGIKINDALKHDTPIKVIKSLIQDKLTGHTVVYTQNECYILEGYKYRDDTGRHFSYRVKKLNHDDMIARTNHGHWIKRAGYQMDGDMKQQLSRVSSESRLLIAEFVVKNADSPKKMINLMAEDYIDNPQLNILRTMVKNGDLRTTSQILIIPSRNTIYFRPIESHIASRLPSDSTLSVKLLKTK